MAYYAVFAARTLSEKLQLLQKPSTLMLKFGAFKVLHEVLIGTQHPAGS